MKAEYINPITDSIVTVLSTMAMIDPKPGKPSLKTGSDALGDITGHIALSGEGTHGSLAISFSEPAILAITESMLGESVDSIDETVVDMVGEITNMITGSAKRIYSEQGLEFDLTLPDTWVGKGQPTGHNVKGKVIVLPFSIDAGDFYIEICFAS